MQQQGYIPADAASPSTSVSSDDVKGTDVYSPTGDHLGKIDHLVIDKRSGNIGYAVMTFGGFLGLGANEHPVPWKKLRYDVSLGGYVTDITKDQLEGAPEHSDRWAEDRDYARRSYEYYGVPPYWL